MANFLEKWTSKKADKPKAGARNVVDTFRARVAEQKAYLEEYERDAAGFKKWRSTWFQRVPGGFGVTVGRDSINAGRGLSYVVVDTVKDVAEFLDDLAFHAENDVGFQQALEQNRQRRVALLNAAKTGGKATASKTKAKAAKPAATVKSAAAKPAATKAAPKAAAPKATRTKAASVAAPAPAAAEAAKPKRTRKTKAAGAAE
ncbi:hypothetical protein RsS62_28870 [Rhizobium dioscoreae]|uniref:Uncharacterized protein n=1 Tax=Rhizobium dioscoreae TaxID=2653122 RepID=A0ABQ0Z122_9HYPH|nr:MULTISPECIES: hypothetical protein [Rhizobium]MCZ3376945.1 hypothetical protein [Rhizobium sp. AG207R]TWB12521.1 hypothetical protein FBZ99_10680 [Rhizobium sp. ERR1071]GES43635.1 hypothetical protein RsS62_28870 [Rhizobium dioscoreae]GES48994.1 hypothetical protein RsS93_16080 [Rhizobium dioscoreae]GLU80437.1 hypothetical protein Rhsp01_16130 [Rhizobium sp. NBRC 114257]